MSGLLEKKYKEQDTIVQTAKELAQKWMDEQMDGTIDYDNSVSFEHFGIEIVNPFMDNTGRWGFTLDEAYTYYGCGTMNWYLDKVSELHTR